jgi:ADP-ribose pyrophosphatase YjhB (NUDIX family)
VLLVRTEYLGSKWQLPGGFVEKGETLTDALRREIEEELDIEIEIVGVLGTYYREFDRNVNLVFLIDGPASQIVADGREVLEARFFGVDNLPGAISPRTRMIIHDVLSDRRSRLVVFRTPSDLGEAIE